MVFESSPDRDDSPNEERIALAAISGAALVQLAWFLRAMHRFTGRPGGALDDAYIHFQFATLLAQGHFYEWTPGGGYSTGATSVLWPALLAPAHWLGLREERMALWAAALGAMGLWVCAFSAYRVLSESLASRRWGALGAALVLTNGALLWGSFGGMEVPLVAALVMGVVHAVQRSRPRTALVLAALLPLARPEWTVVTLMVIGFYVVREPGWRPLLALAPLAAYLTLNLVFTGRLASNGAIAKSLAWDPDLTPFGMARTWAAQVGELLRDHVGRPRLVAVGAPILAVAGVLRGSPGVRLAGFAALAGLVASVTVMDPFRHWSRYQIPALPPLLVAAVAGVPALAGLARSKRGRTVAAALLSAALLGSQVSSLTGYNDLFAYNCRDILFQQVRMGAWMREHLPAGTRVAVHDAGAIPLVSRLPVLDLLGLGTPGFPEAWREGEGALYEALERLPPGRRPRFFAVYERWVPLPDLFGRAVHRVVLDDNRTCGDAEKVLFEARWDVLDGADRPLLSHNGVIADEVDVADLESERAHDYAIDRPSRTIYRREPTEGRAVSDGGRVQHAFESMRLAVTPGRDAHLVWRTDAWLPARIRVLVDGTVVARLPLSEVRAFIEPEVLLPGSSLKRARPVVRVEQEGQGEMSSFHYWVLQ